MEFIAFKQVNKTLIICIDCTTWLWCYILAISLFYFSVLPRVTLVIRVTVIAVGVVRIEGGKESRRRTNQKLLRGTLTGEVGDDLRIYCTEITTTTSGFRLRETMQNHGGCGGGRVTTPSGTQSHQSHLTHCCALRRRGLAGCPLFPFSLCMHAYVRCAHVCNVKSSYFVPCLLVIGEEGNWAEMEMLTLLWKARASLVVSSP